MADLPLMVRWWVPAPLASFASATGVILRSIRRTWGAAWMQGTVPKNWYGTENKPAERAVWTHAVAVKYPQTLPLGFINSYFLFCVYSGEEGVGASIVIIGAEP